MEKYKVANGIFYISIPEVDLRILCGCPADTVKHLLKRGFILNQEKDGVQFETGPNAILLSDVSIQKGAFSNLTEFPVLQMFYRQGMLIPKHPNNYGKKPILIGLEDQVKSQEEYIYRGNYGLTSIEEMTSAGIDEAKAKEMMRLKLRFAFNSIKQTKDLLDRRIVDREIIEIKDGVYLHRTGFNKYDFHFRDEKISVDLNLGEEEKYQAPYTLGYYKIARHYFSVIHIGEGDGWDYNRPCMGSILAFQGKVYLIDAGPGILESLTALGIGINEIEGIFHTHCHDDHFAGLTSLLRSDHRMKYFATPLVRSSVMKKLAALLSMEEERFFRFFEPIDLEFDEWNDIDGLEVKPVFSPHPVETSIMFFRSFWNGGYKSYAHFADIASFSVLGNMVEPKKSKSGISKKFFEQVKRDYLESADIKKLDIGGGLIHGNAEDFASDTSGKILLSHTSKPLNDSQKSIGSNAPFGMRDVLISGREDYSLSSIQTYLRSYFPNALEHDIRMILNCPVQIINPGSILIKKGQAIQTVYMLINGVAEAIGSKGPEAWISPGSFIGELAGPENGSSQATYRTSSYVRVLSIPIELYNRFIEKNNLSAELKKTCEDRRTIQNTSLFSESISSLVQNKLVQSMQRTEVKARGQIKNTDATGKEQYLILVEKGLVNLHSEGKTIDQVYPGEYFGEDSLIIGGKGIFRYIAAEDSTLIRIPHSILRDIPIVQWKLFERLEHRLKLLQGRFAFEWYDSYALNIPEIDEEHKELFRHLRELYDFAERGDFSDNYQAVIESFISGLKSHLEHEEGLLKDLGFKEIVQQQRDHKKVLSIIDSYMSNADRQSSKHHDFLTQLRSWVLIHTLIEDRKYAPVISKPHKV